MAHTPGDAGPGEVGLERGAVARALLGVAGDLLRATVAAGVGIDRHDLDTVGRGGRQDDRRAPLEAADLDDPAAARAAGSSVVQAAALVVGHPPLDLRRKGQGI